MHWTVTALLLAVHLLLVDVAMVGPLLAVWYDVRGRRASEPRLSELGRQLAWSSLAGLAGGGLLGGLLLAARYATDERYLRALLAVPRDRLWFAVTEYLFALVCLGAFAILWRRWQRRRWGLWLVALAGASNLLIHFPALFIIVSVLGSRPGALVDSLERSDYRYLLIDGEVLARVVHVWLAAIAVTAMLAVWLVLRAGRAASEADERADEQTVRGAGRLAVTAVMLQFPVGLWVALVMPESSQRNLMGGDAIASVLFLAAVGLTMLLINLLSSLVLGEDKLGAAKRSTAVLLAVVVLMVATRLRAGHEAQRPAPDGAGLALPAAAALASGETFGSIDRPAASQPEVAALNSLEIVTIADPVHGSKAKILPGLGFNCYGFVASAPTGPLDVLWSAPDFTDGTAKPTGSGIPLLFPFAGRIRGATFNFEGKTYTLDEGDGIGNAIHGFVFNRQWRVIEQEKDRVLGEFHASEDDESLLEKWPADFRIRAEYRIAGNTLTAEYQIDNPDDKPLPFGFGTHPYFRVPLGGTSADDCQVKIPVASSWELEELLPTGRTTESPIADKLAAGMPVSEMRLDNVFGGLKFENHRLDTSIHDPHSGRRVTQEFGDQFTTCVVYNPPHREAVCIEPYTTVPDAFALIDAGHDPHLLTLAPGETFRTRIEIRVD